eukprot:PITA_00872
MYGFLICLFASLILAVILAGDMEQQRLWIVVVMAMAMMVLPFNCLATDYTVGDSAQWNLGVNYKTWASGKTFVVGDKLVFKYTPGTHTVLVVNKAAYDSCTTSNPLATHTSGNDSITLDSTGAKYYICGITGHCSAGMKVTITVGAASASKKNGTAPSPSPARSPSSSAPPTTPTVQSPSPSSAAPTAPTVGSPSPSSTAPTTPTVGTPSPSSAATPTAVQTPSSSTNGASTASPSYRIGAVLLGGSLLLAMASL